MIGFESRGQIGGFNRARRALLRQSGMTRIKRVGVGVEFDFGGFEFGFKRVHAFARGSGARFGDDCGVERIGAAPQLQFAHFFVVRKRAPDDSATGLGFEQSARAHFFGDGKSACVIAKFEVQTQKLAVSVLARGAEIELALTPTGEAGALFLHFAQQRRAVAKSHVFFAPKSPRYARRPVARLLPADWWRGLRAPNRGLFAARWLPVHRRRWR